MTFKTTLLILAAILHGSINSFGADNLDTLSREIAELKKRVTALEEQNLKLGKQIEVEKLIIKKELIWPAVGEGI